MEFSFPDFFLFSDLLCYSPKDLSFGPSDQKDYELSLLFKQFFNVMIVTVLRSKPQIKEINSMLTPYLLQNLTPFKNLCKDNPTPFCILLEIIAKTM